MTATLTKIDVDLMAEVADDVFELCYDPEIQSDPEYKQDHLLPSELALIERFCDELDVIGIQTVDQYKDRLYTCSKPERGMSAEAVFTEEQIDDQQLVEETWIVVDYQATWDRNLRFDYNTVTDGQGHTWFFINS
jgi:hypothetical protein